MSDTIFAMRWLVAVGLVAACSGDPELHVTVTHPPGLAIASTTVTDYESASLSCEDIEFQRQTSEELAAVEIASETILASGSTSGGLHGISRTANKVIVARGFDATTQLIAIGCAQHGVVSGNAEVAIATFAAATASIGLPDAQQPDQTQVLVTATDPSGMLLDGRPVSWTVYGPAGATPAITANATAAGDGVWQATMPTCTRAGVAKVHPIPAGVIGGYEVQMRVAWARELPPTYSALDAGTPQALVWKPPAGSRRYCAVRVSGVTRRLDCLEDTGTAIVARELAASVAGGVVTLTPVDTQVVPEAVALISVPDGSDRDVFAVTQRGRLIGVFPSASSATPDNSTPVCSPVTCTTPVDDAVVVPACDAAPGRIVMHLSGAVAANAQVVMMNALGGGKTTLPVSLGVGETDIDLDNAGCVSALAAAANQVISLHQGARLAGQLLPTTTRIYYDCVGGTCSSSPLLAGAGTGFTGGSEPRIVITSLDATGVVLLQAVFAGASAAQRQLVERARYPALSAPDRMVVGQYDTDSKTDMLWSVTNRRNNATSLEIAYARLIGALPLEAVSKGATYAVDDLISDDIAGETPGVDGDGHDDLVTTVSVAGGGHAIVTIASYVHAPAVTLPQDTPCAP
jgi:hypothetical protein